MDTNTPGAETNTPPTPPTMPTPGPESPQKNTGMAMLAYLGILVLIPLVSEAKNDPFVKFHIKQGLVLLIGYIIASFLAAIPVFGWALSPFVWLGCLILMVIGLMNASAGKEVELPLIGHLSKNFHL
jgi:uncharacterized membrane protein